MKTAKNAQKEMDRDLVCGLLVIAANKDELSADMSLGELLDWMTEKLSNANLPDTILKLSRNENIDIFDIAEALVILNPDDLPHSIEDIRKMNPEDVKWEMKNNEDFYYNTFDVCEDLIDRLIASEKKTADKLFRKGKMKKAKYIKVQKAKTDLDLFMCGYYHDEDEFIDKLVDKYIFAN